MTLQQLKYIVAIDRQRNFAKAAEQCGISQPTLSAMLVKLEEELDVRIFERSNKLVTPTAAGEKIIRQAEKALAEAERITELVAEDKGIVDGELALSVGPTIAPYILPKFIRHYVENYPSVKLSIREMKADVMLSELLLGISMLALLSVETHVRASLRCHSTQSVSWSISQRTVGASCLCSSPRTWNTRRCGL